MAYPATFTEFLWEDLPSENTPFDKERAQEAEKRLAKFTEEYEVHWRFPVKKESELPKVAVAKGDIFLVEETQELVIYNGTEYVKPNVFVPFWKAPVKKESELPIGGNTLGDVRLVTELGQFFFCIKTTGTIGEQWSPANRGHTHTIESPSWVVAEKIVAGIIPGPFRKLAAEETQTLIGIEVELAKGKGSNKIEYNVERYDAEGTKEWKPIPSLEKLKLSKEEVKAVAVSVALHSQDRLRLNILSIVAEPEGLALTAFIEHIAKVV